MFSRLVAEKNIDRKYRQRRLRRTTRDVIIASREARFEVLEDRRVLSSTNVAAGLVGWWEAEGTALNTLGANNGQLINGASFANGVLGQAFSLDGVDDFVRVPASSAIDASFATSATFTAWVNWDGSDDGHVVSTGNDIANQENRFYRLHVNGDGTVYFVHRTQGDASTVYATSAVGLTPGVWHHLAGVREFGNATDGVKLYIDGVLAASVGDNGLQYVATGRNLTFGAGNDGAEGGGANTFFSGGIDEVRAYDRALSGAEVAALVHEPKADAGGSYVANLHESVQLDASGTQDPDQAGSTLIYEWDLDQDNIFGETGVSAAAGDETGMSPTYVAPDSWQHSFNVAVRVTDDTGLTNTDTAAIHLVGDVVGLVGSWQAEGDASDSADGNDGQLVGGVQFNTQSPVVGKSFGLNGIDEAVRIPETSSDLDGFSEMTVAGWIRTSFSNADLYHGRSEGIVTKYDGRLSNDLSYALNLDFAGTDGTVLPVGRLTFSVWGPTGDAVYSQDVPSITIGESNWTHVAAVWKGGAQFALYVNGARVSGTLASVEGTLGVMNDNATPVNIGRYASSSGSVMAPFGYFNGLIDDVRIYSSGLSDADIESIYQLRAIQPSVLSGRVFSDLDNDGVYEPANGELGRAGLSVSLSGANYQHDSINRTTVTASDGAYSFADVIAGTYTLTRDLQAGLLDGKDAAGSRGGIVGDDRIYGIVIDNEGGEASGYDFADILASALYGRVAGDVNDDGQLNAGDTGIMGVLIHVSGTDDRGNNVSRDASTNTSGDYQFSNLRPGNYTVSETQPVGFIDGQDIVGTILDAQTGDNSVNDSISGVIIAAPGLTAQDYSFLERPITAPLGTSISGPTDVVPGISVEFSLSATAPDPGVEAPGFSYSIDWGDGSAPTQIAATHWNGISTTVSHGFQGALFDQLTIQVTATSSAGSTSASHVITLVPIVGGDIVGTSGDDLISVTSTGIVWNGLDMGPTPGGVTFRLGQGGHDVITLENDGFAGTGAGDFSFLATDGPADFEATLTGPYAWFNSLSVVGYEGNDNVSLTVPEPGFSLVSVETFAGDDNITFNGRGPGSADIAGFGSLPATLEGGDGSDTYIINLEGAPTFPRLYEPYRIIEDENASGTDVLIVNGTEGADHITKDVTGGGVTVSDTYETVVGANIEQVMINGQGGNDLIEDPGSDTTLLGGAGDDTIVIDATMGAGVTADGGEGSDTIIAVLGNLAGPVTVLDSGTSGSDTLNIEGTAGDDAISVSATGVTSGSEVVAIASPIAAIVVNAADGNDSIAVSDLAGIAGSVELDGGSGTDSFTLDHVGGSVDSLAVRGGSEGDQLTVEGDLPPGATIETIEIVIINAPPTATASGPSAGVRNQTRTFSFQASDASADDNAAGFEFVVDWGDGSPLQTVPATAGNGAGVALEHAFAAAGAFTVSVTATDQGGETSAAATTGIAISVAAVVGNDLVVGGTSGDDLIHFAAASGGRVKAYVNGTWLGPYTATGRVIAYGGAGNDLLSVGTLANRNGWLFGGDGIDLLNGGSGDDVLDGGAGYDLIAGGPGRDLIVGGDGSDALFGDFDEDVIVAGTTGFDGNELALGLIMAEWTSSRAFQQRVANLEGAGSGSSWLSRANGEVYLVAQPGGSGSATVFDDEDSDLLVGGMDRDWFFANLAGAGDHDLIADLTWRDLADDLVLVDSLDQ